MSRWEERTLIAVELVNEIRWKNLRGYFSETLTG